ncbi:MAG: Asp-tRNA(Asn)/Glu-tRNA(Gln) amidotransferase subunit GatC [Deltaproteobacteria bacterium]|jgi:aspartyl-tRNA(Asn)/glutamyl-tRNA(Gln) amidotransferase subunit C|nr:Asp-tRNA(Asn)/Glu-tRNA(Gln) amidotransferase subunit GatC [Deltaproteobacteria bacterium]
MPIDENTAKSIANLARLELGEERGQEIDQERHKVLVEEFSKIIGYMDILSEAQTDGVEPLFSPMVEAQPPRSDVVVEDQKKADAILAGAPEKIGRYFSVPRIF